MTYEFFKGMLVAGGWVGLFLIFCYIASRVRQESAAEDAESAEEAEEIAPARNHFPATVAGVCGMFALCFCIGGCAAYKHSGALTPDGFNYTISRSRVSGELTDYFGLTWSLK